MNTKELLNLKVKNVMSTNLLLVQINHTMAKADQLMSENGVHHIPVVDRDNNLKGIISKHDVQLLKDWSTKLGLPSSKMANEQLLNSQLASDRMTESLIHVSPDDTLEVCARIFKENLFHCLPVTINGKLVGMLTTYDLIKVAYTEAPLLIKD